MSHVNRQNHVTVIEPGPSYDSLDDAALAEISQLLLAEAGTADPPRLILDLTHTRFIGSSFIELLVRAWKRLKERGGTMAVCGLQPFCAQVLQATRLDTIWNMYDSQPEAIAAMATRGDPPERKGIAQGPG